MARSVTEPARPSQDAQLKFADAPLHAQKKPVVWPTRVIDTVQINNAGFDKPAQFEQMVPISAVPSEPRGRHDAVEMMPTAATRTGSSMSK